MKVVSIAAFGALDNPMYLPRLPAFALAHLNLFPLDEGWRLEVHMDCTVANSRFGAFVYRLEDAGLVKSCVLPEAPLCEAMLWRLLPLWGRDVEYVFARDLDALPTPRDRACCDQFIASGCAVHTIHDHLQHTGIMGGLSGFQVAGFRSATKLESWNWLVPGGAHGRRRLHTKGADQDVLNRLCNVADGPSLLEHRYAGWANGRPGIHPSRTPSTWSCPSVSLPLPNAGHAPRLAAMVRECADEIQPHLGAAGYDTHLAWVFWGTYGDPQVLKQVRAAQAAAGLAE